MEGLKGIQIRNLNQLTIGWGGGKALKRNSVGKINQNVCYYLLGNAWAGLYNQSYDKITFCKYLFSKL